MIVTSDKYEGNKESARGDLLDVLEYEDKVEELLAWLEGFLPGQLNKLTNQAGQASGNVDQEKPKAQTKKPDTKAAPKKEAPKDKTTNPNANQKKPAPAVKKDANPATAQTK